LWWEGYHRRYRSRDVFTERRREAYIGPRAPVGLSYNFRKVPIEVFGEIALVLDLIPATGADLDLALGGRYYF
jgi:hypothetical protein